MPKKPGDLNRASLVTVTAANTHEGPYATDKQRLDWATIHVRATLTGKALHY